MKIISQMIILGLICLRKVTNRLKFRHFTSKKVVNNFLQGILISVVQILMTT